MSECFISSLFCRWNTTPVAALVHCGADKPGRIVGTEADKVRHLASARRSYRRLHDPCHGRQKTRILAICL